MQPEPGQGVESESPPEHSQVVHSAQVSPLREVLQRAALCSQAEPQVQQLVLPAERPVQQVSERRERREHQVLAQPAEQVSAQRALPLSLQVPA